jgi:hypothetical protein
VAKAKLRFTENDVARAIRSCLKTGLAVDRVVVETNGDIVVVAAADATHTPILWSAAQHEEYA